MTGLHNKIKQLEQRLGDRKPHMGIPLMFSYPDRDLFADDDEQRAYMDWRLKQVRAEYARTENYLPIPIMMLVNRDDIRDHIGEFRSIPDMHNAP